MEIPDWHEHHEARLASDEEYRAQYDRLAGQLEPEYLRQLLQFAALYQLIHEQIKYSVLDLVRNYYLGPAPFMDDASSLHKRTTKRF